MDCSSLDSAIDSSYSQNEFGIEVIFIKILYNIVYIQIYIYNMIECL